MRKQPRTGRSKAVLLDRDGTIIHDRPGHYLSRPQDIRLYKNAPAALKLLQKAGFRLFIVSNQSGIGRGFFSLKTANDINFRLLELLRKKGVKVEAVYFCPHKPQDNCGCRKPEPLMGRKIIKKHGIQPAASYVMGDKLTDMEFARRLGMTAVFVKTGHGRTQLQKYGKIRAHTDILFGAKWIIKNEIQNKTDTAYHNNTASHR